MPSTTEASPFCSPRCRLVDLGRWLGEEYRIPAVDEDDVEAPAAPTGPPAPAGAPPLRN